MHFIVLNVSGYRAALPAWRPPDCFPPMDVYGVSAPYDQYSPKQDQDLFPISEGYFRLPTTLSRTNQLANLQVYDDGVKMR